MTKDKANPKTYMRRAIKKELVKYKGGKCERCGTVFGAKEWYRCFDWDWISEPRAKEVLDKLGKL